MTLSRPRFAAFLSPLLVLTGLSVQSPQPRAAESPTASLTISITGLKSASGSIYLALDGSPQAYSGKAESAAGVTIPLASGPQSGAPSTTLTGLSPGRYAIKAFHDLNGNARLDTGPLGIPKEPFAFSNNARPVMGPPPWKAAVFEVKPGRNTQTIRID